MIELSTNDNEINILLDNIEFIYIDSVKNENVENKPVYDLEINEIPNYNTNISIVHNGGGRRKGSFAIYLEPWHPDIFEFLDLRKNSGKEELRCRNLNLAIWAPDLFFQRVEEDKDWTLMDPNKCHDLPDTYGAEFNKLYESYEAKGMGEKTVKARDVWNKILDSCLETGEPYILAKDACNIKSNQKNLGTVKSSNLCAEVVEYSDENSIAVCNLASISLPSCVVNNKFDFKKLENITKILVENLNKVIDVEYYPIDKAKKTNLKDRPIGIGIQGLGTLFAMLRYSWESEEAKILNRNIAETIYYTAMKTSCELAKQSKPYKTFKGSPLSQGLFQFDLWNVKPSDRYDWETLREDIKKHGVKNSLNIALMPTASCQFAENIIKLPNNNAKSLYQIMDDQEINWKIIENIDQQMTIPFKTPIKILTKDGICESPGVHYNGYKNVYEVEFEDGNKYIYTGNHLLLVNRNNNEIWIRVDKITDSDEIINI